MSLIDVENAKQIRDPMDVLIKMEVPEEVNLTYSGYSSSSKVADAVLDERGWPMRILADLQGNGFQLDGSCQLYDPTVTPSATNGKLGVRGNIGQRLSITVTGDTVINGLSIVASGTDAVHFNGQTAALSGGQVIIPVGASSITIEFDPLTSDTRAEVSTAMAGTSIQVTNDSIISCVVSLRSDLSIDNPTLPESEINIDIYNDVDISAVVATIPDDTPITYSAGYVGDMSKERQFYLADQITWADNILSIHAIDAVHFLDGEFPSKSLEWAIGSKYPPSLTKLAITLTYLIKEKGVNVESKILRMCEAYDSANYTDTAFIPSGNLRELIAFVNNLFKIEGLPLNTFINASLPAEIDAFWVRYVDAGKPVLDTKKPSAIWTIEEEDCGDIKKMVEPPLSKITAKQTQVSCVRYATLGNVTWEKSTLVGFPTLDMVTNQISAYGLRNVPVGQYRHSICPIIPVNSVGRSWTYLGNINVGYGYYWGSALKIYNGTGSTFPLIDEESLQNIADKRGGVVCTQVVPSNLGYNDPDNPFKFSSKRAAWNHLVSKGFIGESDETADLEIIGMALQTYEVENTYTNAIIGNSQSIEYDSLINGEIVIADNSHNFYAEGFPKKAYESLLQRSNVTGSFTWKGDPRMQPRDVANFHRLDGTVEEITLENITIHHEGGGTYAEITYRKGIC